MNRYSYVQNNPLGATDPSGHLFFPFDWEKVKRGAQYVWSKAKEGWDNFQAERAWQAFQNGSPIEVVGEYGSFILDSKKLFGRNLHNLDQIDSGRLRGYGRGITDLNGGDSGARGAFEALTGNKAVGDYARWVDPKGNFEVVFRSAARSGSGIPTIEVIHHVERFLEKIKFLP